MRANWFFRAVSCSAALAAGVWLANPAGLSAVTPQDDKSAKSVKKASLNLKASPTIVFSPARVVVSAELRGGADDTDELYCPSLEWDWGDGTKSEAGTDCEPFEAGTSAIQRRFTSSHTYNIAGNYRVQLRLKRGSKINLGGHVSVQVKPGLRDPTENFQ
jgi:PKD repeat protein